MAPRSPFQLFLLLLPLLSFLIRNTAAEANPVIIAGPLGTPPQQPEEGSVPVKTKNGWWTVDRSPPGIQPPSDAWWTGCQNRTSEDQKNVTAESVVGIQACLDWYYWGGLKDQWTGTVCNRMAFFRGAADGYSDSAACYEKCYGCLTQSIQAGSVNAICRDGHGYGVQMVLTGDAETPDK
ncbi:MAG: hypothetical protein Q9221_007413 [Calogaya cf. arnoldii]